MLTCLHTWYACKRSAYQLGCTRPHPPPDKSSFVAVQDLRPRIVGCQPHDPLQQQPPPLAARPQRSEEAVSDADVPPRCAAILLTDADACVTVQTEALCNAAPYNPCAVPLRTDILPLGSILRNLMLCIQQCVPASFRRTAASRLPEASPALAALLEDIAVGAGGTPSATDGASLAGA
jgi:hypothetical protein